MNIIDKIAWIEIQNKCILVAITLGKKKYYIPGGKRENSETDEQTLCREIKEELNVAIQKDTIKFVGVFQAQADERALGMLVKMTCFRAKYTGHLKASAEIETIKWLKFADKDKVSEVDKLIFDYLKEMNLLD